MSYEVRGNTIGVFDANVDLSAKQYRFVTFDSTSGKLNVVGTAGLQALGILQNNPLAGQQCTVAVDWPASKLVLSDTVSQGGVIKSANDGTGIPASTSGKGLGIALQDGVAGDIIAVMMKDLGTQS